MTVNSPTISIGIPAHNEERMLPPLLISIIAQDRGRRVKEIIVIADGCTDATVEKVQSINDPRIILIDDKKRKGKSQRLNEIIEKFTGDILLCMDADIVITDKEFFSKVAAIKSLSQSGVIGVNTLPLKSNNFFQACLNYSIIAQRYMIKNWRAGNNYLAFRGSCLILDKPFAKQLVFPQNLVNNDGYIYFYAHKKGLMPSYREDIVVYFIAPASLKDHINQSSRFLSSRRELERYFTIDDSAYHIPKLLVFQTVLLFGFLHPILFCGYGFITLITKYKKEKKVKAKWEQASSTK